jgi:uncharacterized membrane protein YdjX (TVP38/TMEM64 family)
MLGTVIGIIPTSAFNVYLGSLVADMTHLISIDTIAQSPMTVWLYWVEQQFDPTNKSFITRIFSITHINLNQRNWTA